MQKLAGDDTEYKVPKTLHGARPPKDPVLFAEWMTKMEKHVAEQLRKRAGKKKEATDAPQAKEADAKPKKSSKEIDAKPKKGMKSKKQTSSGTGAEKKVKSKTEKKMSAWARFVQEKMPTMTGKEDTKYNMRAVAAMWKQEKESFTAAVALEAAYDVD